MKKETKQKLNEKFKWNEREEQKKKIQKKSQHAMKMKKSKEISSKISFRLLSRADDIHTAGNPPRVFFFLSPINVITFLFEYEDNNMNWISIKSDRILSKNLTIE